MPARPDSGSDAIPVTYPVTITATRYWWEPGREDDVNPVYIVTQIAVPTYAPILVRGPNSRYLQHLATYGSVSLQITQTNLTSGTPGGFSGTPVYADVWFDGVDYKMEVGIVVPTVPRIVYDILNNSGGSFLAVIV